MNEQDLLDLKKEIDEANETSAELNGRLKQLLKQLREDWEYDTEKQAEKKMETMDGEIIQLNDQIKKGTEELESKYMEE